MAGKTRILFLIPSLVAHGAERQLCELVRNMDPDRFELHVAVFYDPADCIGGDLAPDLAGLAHVRLHRLHKRRGALGSAAMLPRLLGLAGRIDPHIVHGYLDGNLAALLAGPPLGKRVVWGIRAANADPARLTGLSRAVFRAHLWASRFVDLAIFNSQAGRASHLALGLRARHSLVIPNGFDTARFHPDPAAGARRREAWGLAPEVPLVGIVGRLDPVKDHPTFLRAAARLAQDRPDLRFVCVGAGPAGCREHLRSQALALGLGERVLWPGACDDMPGAYNALSLLILSSTDEGFPNVIGEAMACGVPCVATRVGDAELLIGGTGGLAAPGDDAALAQAARRLLEESPVRRRARAAAAEARIREAFSCQSLARTTENALLGLLAGTPIPAGATE
ncbi:MAG: glycosyltransferase [Holophaga sp.]|jgi:glycosyltransferase involved in cell wall biosynthesis